MTSVIVPPVDLAPGLPSRVVTVKVIDVTEGQAVAGAKIDFFLPGDLHNRDDDVIISAGRRVTLTLDSDGEGRVRLPTHGAADIRPKDWVIGVKKHWAPHPYYIRVPAGSTTISLARIAPVQALELEGAMADWIITDASVTVTEGAQWDASASVDSGLIHLALTVPPGGEAWSKGMLTTSSNIDELAAGIVGIPSGTVANALPIPVKRPGVIETSWGAVNGFYRTQVYRTSYLEPQAWVRSYAGSWGPWLREDALVGRSLTAADHLDNLAEPGRYFIPNGTIAEAIGAPENIASDLLVTGAGGLLFQSVTTGNLSGGRGVRQWFRIKSTVWSEWRGTAGSVPGRDSLLWLEDTPGFINNVIQIEHRADGSGRANGQTYGIDIHNYPDARQALVIHQYSRSREAFRLDNTDSESALYINNTENYALNPDRDGVGPFLKLHPYNMGNFLDFAYLMDDLTWKNDTTKTWSFQSKTGNVLEIKNSEGIIVASISQEGSISSPQMMALENRIAALEALLAQETENE